MKSLLTWTERRLLRLFRKLSTRQNLHLKAEMFSFHSKYFVYRELKSAPQKLSFCFKCPDTGTVRIPGNIQKCTKIVKKSLFCHQTDYFDVIVAVAVKPLLLTLCWNNKKLEYLTWKLHSDILISREIRKRCFEKLFKERFQKVALFRWPFSRHSPGKQFRVNTVTYGRGQSLYIQLD